MKSNTEQVLDWLDASEGGYVNHPDDPGGPTNMGVTQRVYDGWRKSRGSAVQSVREINVHEARKIFRDQYFVPVRFDDLPDGLDYAMADFSVNSGPGRAIKILQQVLVDLGSELDVDGHMGTITLAAINDQNTETVITELCRARMEFLKRLKNWPSFGKGWTRRVVGTNGVLNRAIAMVTRDTPVVRPSPTPGGKSTIEPAPSILDLIRTLLMAIFGGRK